MKTETWDVLFSLLSLAFLPWYWSSGFLEVLKFGASEHGNLATNWMLDATMLPTYLDGLPAAVKKA